ncbi:unnamed protein product [Closterium sp. NIES-64]|nr:unnamed protein product [Closterium sp. NIES-64]
MATPSVLAFDAEGRAIDFEWATRDAAARLAVRRHLPTSERAHFSQYKSAQTLYNAVVARYSSPATAALSRLMLPYLFPDLSAFPIVADLITHLRTSDTRYRAALPAEFCAKNPPPHVHRSLLRSPRASLTPFASSGTTFSQSVPPPSPSTSSRRPSSQRRKSIVALGASRGDPRTPIFEGCSPSPLLPSVASAAAADLLGLESVSAASAPSGRRSLQQGQGGQGRGWSWRGRVAVAAVAAEGVGVAAGLVAGVVVVVAAEAETVVVVPAVVVEAAAVVEAAEVEAVEAAAEEAGGGGGGGAGRGGTQQRTGGGGGQRSQRQQQQRSRDIPPPQQLREWYAGRQRGGGYWSLHLRSSFRRPRGAGVAIFDLDFDAILAAMYVVDYSEENEGYRCFQPDPGIGTAALGACEAAALGASASVLSSTGETALSGTASSSSSLTFTLDSGASRSFFRDRTTLTPLGRPVAVSLADPSGGPVLSHFSLSSRVRLPLRAPCRVAASGQVLAAASRSGPESAPCSCRLLSHETLLWHHRLGHPSLPRLRSMASRVLVSGLPQSLPPLPLRARTFLCPLCRGRLRATPHSSHFPPTEAPLQTLHMDVRGPAPVRGQGHERYFLLVVDDYSRYTTVLPLRQQGCGH